MINIKTNIIQVEKALQEKFAKLEDKEYLLRPVMFGLIDLMHKRIHNDGKDSTDAQIGTYSTGYMKLRAHSLPAIITKGKNAGKQRVYDTPNRGTDTKVVISMTRKLENEWTVVPTDKGYGIGFISVDSFNKSQWVESTYKKKIFSMTTPEHDYSIEYINDLVNAALNE